GGDEGTDRVERRRLLQRIGAEQIAAGGIVGDSGWWEPRRRGGRSDSRTVRRCRRCGGGCGWGRRAGRLVRRSDGPAVRQGAGVAPPSPPASRANPTTTQSFGRASVARMSGVASSSSVTPPLLRGRLVAALVVGR